MTQKESSGYGAHHSILHNIVLWGVTGAAVVCRQKILVDWLSAGQLAGESGCYLCVSVFPVSCSRSLWGSCVLSGTSVLVCPPFPLSWLCLAWGITTSSRCKSGKWVSSANWKSRLVTHVLHKEGIIFEPLFTTESLLFEEKMRRIVCVKAEQKQKPQQEEKDTWNEGEKRLSFKCKMILS